MENQEMIHDSVALEQTVFPSEKKTIGVSYDDTYGGAHKYVFVNCLGFSDGETKYDNTIQSIQFVKKELDGSITPGLQSEQLVIALLDRVNKLNEVFPCEENELQIKALNDFLEACKMRVIDRITREVNGKLEK